MLSCCSPTRRSSEHVCVQCRSMPSAGRQCALERGRRVLACVCTSQGSWQTTEGVQRREKAERAELRNIAKTLSRLYYKYKIKSNTVAVRRPENRWGKLRPSRNCRRWTRNELAGAVWCTASRSALMVGGGEGGRAEASLHIAREV